VKNKSQRRRIALWVAVAVVGAALASFTVFFADAGPKISRLSNRWVCPCVFIEGRSAQACRATVPLDLGGLVRVEINESQRVSQTTILGLFASRARHYPGSGCVMEQ
jgi:hypothetical protein